MVEIPKSPTLVTLGQTIRLYREAAGLTQRALAEEINYSNGWLGEVETGTQRPAPKALAEIEGVLGVPAGVLGKILALTSAEARHPVQSFGEYREAERTADEIHTYQALVIHGLLQTEDYARALIEAETPNADPDTIADRLAARMERQAILARTPKPDVTLLINETALRQPAGSSEIHRAQLDRLLDAARGPGVTVQVIPQAARRRAGLVSSFTILSFAGAPSVAYSADPVVGHILRQPTLVKGMWRALDAVRTSALPAENSSDLIQKIREEV